MLQANYGRYISNFMAIQFHGSAICPDYVTIDVSSRLPHSDQLPS